MDTLKLKFSRLSAVIVLSFCMLCGNNVKTYAQPELHFSASDGQTLTAIDVLYKLIVVR